MDKNLKWRLILGKPDDDNREAQPLPDAYAGVDESLEFIYGEEARKGLNPSSPAVNKWLGDIRTYFSRDVVEILQKDAYIRLNLRQMLLEPELLAALEHNVDLVANLIRLNKLMPEKTRESARSVIRKIVARIEKKLKKRLHQQLGRQRNNRSLTRKPRLPDIHWHKTIRKNLVHYQPDLNRIIPQTVIGYQRENPGLEHVIILVDQSASMANSVVYAGIMGAILASIRSLQTHLILFDTEVADVTAELSDPVDILLAAQLGGGTDITNALRYAKKKIRSPQKTWLLVITDLQEGSREEELLAEARAIRERGVTMSVILALSDEGLPVFNRSLAKRMSSLHIPSFACTPDRFPVLLIEQMRGQSLMKYQEKFIR